MKNLSIVICSQKNKIHDVLNIIEPLLEDHCSELIIIGNDIATLETEYNYSLYKYTEGYENFKDFCLSICQNSRIVVIEDGLELKRNFIDQLKDNISTETDYNFTCLINKYINSEENKFYTEEYVVLYNRNTSNKKMINDILNDYSIIIPSTICINKALIGFINCEKYSEFYIWYNEYVLNQNSVFIKSVYECLEKIKFNFIEEKVSLIENLFLKDCRDEKYCKYLKLKILYNERQPNYLDNISNILDNIDLNEEDIYFSNFILLLFKTGKNVVEIIRSINSNLVSFFIKYLINRDDNFYLDIYSYMTSIDLSYEICKINNKDVLIYINIIKAYIEALSEESVTYEKKNKLVQLFIDYTNYGFYFLNDSKKRNKRIKINSETMFLIEVDKAVDKINENKIEEAILILKKAANIFPIMNRTIEYYIQKLRFENRKYPYKLSICMIVKDEEKNIERCLTSLKPLVSEGFAELIIVDTGSSDKTIELSKKYTNNIYSHPWNGSFSEARNYSISFAQGEYVFIMDADEEIEYSEINKLIYEFSNDDYKNYNSFSFRIKNFSDYGLKKFSIFTQNLIFKNDGSFYYTGSVHNQPVYKYPTKHTNITILHYGYIMSEDIKDKKFNRTATLLKKELEKNPKNIYYRFQLSTSYSMHGDLKEALNQVEIYMRLLKESNHKPGDNLMFYNNAALVYMNNSVYDKVIEVSDIALSVQPDFIDFIYYKTHAFFEKKMFDKAINYAKEYLSLIDEFDGHDIIHDDRVLFYCLDSKENVIKMLLVSLNKVGNYEECIENIVLLQDGNTIKGCLFTVIESYFMLKRYSELAGFYENVVYNREENDIRDIFIYFVEENLLKLSTSDQKECIMSLAKSNIDDEYIDILKFRAGNEVEHDVHRILKFIDSYDLDNIDSVSAVMIINKVLPIFDTYNLADNNNIEIKNLKRSAKFILARSLNLKQYTKLNKKELLDILDKYINYCLFLVRSGCEELLEAKEVLFINSVFCAFKALNDGDLVKCVKYLRNSVIEDKVMAKPIELFLETIIPGYHSDSDYEVEKAKNELEEHKVMIKKKIEELISQQNLEEAEYLIRQYEEIVNNDVEVISFLGIIKIMQENYSEAIQIFIKGLEVDSKNFDLLYNLGYLYSLQNIPSKSLTYYGKALDLCQDEQLKEDIINTVKEIMDNHKELISRKRIAFFVKKDMDNFIDDIIQGLSSEYETKKVIVTEYYQIDNEIEWSDILWFEWCDELVIYVSKMKLPYDKKVICRLHSYEAFTDYPAMVNWDNVDRIIFISKHIKDYVLQQVNIPENKIDIIPALVNIDKFSYRERKKGFNVAYLGYINYKKGPMLLIQFINELVKKDKRYKLFIGGKFQDGRDLLYFNQMIMEFKLENNIIFDGWIEDTNSWLEDKNYIISSSLLEGQQLSVMEGMCKGIKPIIHNFVGAKSIYNQKYIWNTPAEAVEMIISDDYYSKEYRDFIFNNYNTTKITNSIAKSVRRLLLVNQINNLLTQRPLITIGILSYNYSRFLDEAIISVLKQSYKNIEVIIVDDFSTDGSIEKIKKYEKKYSFIHGIYHDRNSGSAVQGFQEIIKYAKGEYFTFLSADDYYSNNTVIENYVEYFEDDKNLDYVYGNLKVVDLDGSYKTTWKYRDYTDDEIVHNIFIRMGSGVIPFGAGLFKKEFYIKNNLTWINDEKNIVAGDTLNTLMNVKHGWKRKYIDIDTTCYRHHENNMTYNLKQRIESIVSVIKYITNNFSEEKYFPDIKWCNITELNERQALKMFQIGSFLNDIYDYYFNQFKSWDGKALYINTQETSELLQPIVKEMNKCFDISINLSDAYKNKIELIKKI